MGSPSEASRARPRARRKFGRPSEAFRARPPAKWRVGGLGHGRGLANSCPLALILTGSKRFFRLLLRGPLLVVPNKAHIEHRRGRDLDPDPLLRLPFLLNLLHDLTREPGPAHLGLGLDPDSGVPQPPELRSGERQLRHPRRRARGPRRCRISNWRRCEITDRRHCRISWLHASRATPLLPPWPSWKLHPLHLRPPPAAAARIHAADASRAHASASQARPWPPLGPTPDPGPSSPDRALPCRIELLHEERAPGGRATEREQERANRTGDEEGAAAR